jgi:hypothetical protein
MTHKSEFAEFSEIMAALALNFSAQPPAKPLLDFWWNSFLSDGFSISDIRGAASSILRNRIYTKMPTYADFRIAINGEKEEIENRAVMVAWQNLTMRLREAGANECRKRGFRDAKINFSVRMLGGWDVLRNWKDSELPFREKDFKERYLAAMRDETIMIEYRPGKQIKGLIEGIGGLSK